MKIKMLEWRKIESLPGCYETTSCTLRAQVYPASNRDGHSYDTLLWLVDGLNKSKWGRQPSIEQAMAAVQAYHEHLIRDAIEDES